MIREAARTTAALAFALGVVAWALVREVRHRDVKPANVRRPRAGPL